MKKIIFIIVFSFAAFLFPFNVAAQKSDSIIVLAKAENIKNYPAILKKISPKPVNDNPLPGKPALKSAEKYNVTINNSTGYTIDIYNDSLYIGTIAAWKTDYMFPVSDLSGLIGLSVGHTKIWAFPVHFEENKCYRWILLDNKNK